MCAKSDQAEPRDRAINRLLVEALQSSAPAQAAAATHVSHDSCPDTELIAAYADQALAPGERSAFESHAAACEHCQHVLAALSAGLEAPVGGSVAMLPAPATVPASPRPIARPAPSPQRWLWWLTPAFGAAAAALLWMVLRPAAPATVQTAADYSGATAQQESRALDAPAAASRQRQAPAADAPRRDAQAVDRLSKAESPAKENADVTREKSVAQPVAPPADSAAVGAAAAGARSEVATAAVAPQAAVVQGMIASAPAADQRAPQPAPPARNQAAVANEQAPLQARALATFGAAIPQQPAPEPQPGGSGAPAQINLYTFSPPDRGATWRLGTAGRIERSIDQGKTWQQQSSGVTTDLIAGSAATKDAAWVIGRGQIILRTSDGEHWERVTPPANVNSEWAAVAAHDAMNATVLANDLRRFSTEDGGRTWTQQQ